MQSATFAGVMDFDGPQPFNVDVRPELDIAPPVVRPVDGPSQPVVVQEITPDRDLYPKRRHGVVRRR